jgi:hypothetical protein
MFYVKNNLGEKTNLMRYFRKILEETERLGKIFSDDEAWVFQYDPESKFQSLQWKSLESTRS